MPYTQPLFNEISTGSLFFWTAGFLCIFVASLLIIYPTYISLIKNVNGPKPTSLLFGNVVELFTQDSSPYELQWSRTFAGIFSLRWAFGETRLYVSDPAALHHILVTKCYAYPKPDQLRALMSGALGQGLLFAEGDDHKRQRKIVSPAFSAAANKQYSHVFHDKGKELRDKWIVELQGFSTGTIDVSQGIAQCTTDIIGLAGFNHSFDSLSTGQSQLVASLNEIVGSWSPSILGVMQRATALRFPAIIRVAAQLPVRRAKALKECFGIIQKELEGIFNMSVYHHDNHAKDLISSIMNANAKTAKAKDTLSKTETMGQVATIAIAGFETTATAITWALHELSQNETVQHKLRNEVRDMIEIKGGDSDMTDDDFCRMPYLDAFVREVLRFYPPIESTLREAAKDDILPLSEPHLSRDGKTYLTHIPIKKGQKIIIGILAHNRDKKIWGEDADVFRPERWLEMDDSTGLCGEGYNFNTKGKMRGFTTWSSTLSFLGGPRGCLGYRFALREIKTILFILVDTLTFEPRDKNTVVIKRTTFVARPLIEGEEALGNQLPLRISLATVRD